MKECVEEDGQGGGGWNYLKSDGCRHPVTYVTGVIGALVRCLELSFVAIQS